MTNDEFSDDLQKRKEYLNSAEVQEYIAWLEEIHKRPSLGDENVIHYDDLTREEMKNFNLKILEEMTSEKDRPDWLQAELEKGASGKKLPNGKNNEKGR